MKDLVQTLIRSGVAMPGRYAGGEFFNHPPVPPTPGDLRIALVFPEVYEVGMSNLGLEIMYSLLRVTPGVFVDRVFAPWPDMEKLIRAGTLPLVSRDLGIPAGDFDVLAFSLSSELLYTNALNIIDLAGLALRQVDRDPGAPLVIAGGICASHPEPLAPFFDAFCLGDAECMLGPLVELLSSHGFHEKRRRPELLAALDGLPGTFVPSLHLPAQPEAGLGYVPGLSVRKQFCPDLHQRPDLSYFPVPSSEIVFDRISLEITRGCVQGCRFCEAGYFYRPMRERRTADLIREGSARIGSSGMEELGLASLSTADKSDLEALVCGLVPLMENTKTSLSVSSLRAYGVGDVVLAVMSAGRTTSLTLAPETSARLRPSINKNVSDEDLLGAVSRMAEAGWDRVKLYFMLGLPGETDEDARLIAGLASAVHQAGSRIRGRRFATVLSASMFVPRPHTPFQWAAMASQEELRRRVSIIRAAVNRGVDFKWHDSKTSSLETALARGDRRLADVVESAWKNGARFDAWVELFDQRLWQQAFDEHGLDPEQYLAAPDPDRPLPWDHMDVGVSKSFLLREWQKAQEGIPTPACTPADPKLVCHGCGIGCRQQPPEQAAPASPPPLQAQPAQPAPLVKVRYTFERLGPAVVLGNLDLMRVLTRALRRAGLEVSYSEGFHPRIRMSMGPPLPLGHSGAAEYFEVRMPDPGERAPEILELMNSKLPEGLRVVSLAVAGEIPGGQPVACVYEVQLSVTPAIDCEEFLRQVRREGLLLERKGQRRDLAGALQQLVIVPDPEGSGGLARLQLALQAAPRPEEVLMAMGVARADMRQVLRRGYIWG